jgi:2,4-dienoyl-CoA reductase-like NADH-dependent reductase (Old Yellow Enzyme family)/thioredoxin reductase
MIIVEYSYVDPFGKGIPAQSGIYSDKCVAGLHDLAEAIKLNGAKAVIQIHHAGRETKPSTNERPYVVAPSPIPLELYGVTPRELTIPEIEEIIVKFGDAAVRAKIAGFDAVEIHGAHGYLILSFLSPLTNKRADRYGGSEENRHRFGLEIFREIRKRVGENFPIGYRIIGSEFVEGGLTLDHVVPYVKKLEKAGICYISVSGANFDSMEHMITSPYMPPGNLVPLAAKIKKAVSIPVIAVGRLHDPVFADKIIGEGKTDMVAVGRGLIADPDIPNKAQEGKFADIRPCLACNNSCNRNFFFYWPIECDVNYEAGREGKYEQQFKRAEKAKKILIVGGGIAGMEAARVATLRGHKVEIHEKTDRLGGNIIPASSPSFKNELRKFLDYLIHQIDSLKIKVLFGKEVTLETIKKMKPDAVVFATGATPTIPEIPGVNKPHVETAADVLLGKVAGKKKVVVIGGGSVGCETALHLAENKKEVTVIEMLDEVVKDLYGTTSNDKALVQKLDEKRVCILKNTKVVEVTDDGVTVIDKKLNMYPVTAGTVVLAVGLKADALPIEKVGRIGTEFYSIGDCVEPRKVKEAIHDANRVALTI